MSKTKNLNSAEAAKFLKEFKKLFSPKKNCKAEPLNNGNGGFITDSSDIEKELFSTFFEANTCKKKNSIKNFVRRFTVSMKTLSMIDIYMMTQTICEIM